MALELEDREERQTLPWREAGPPNHLDDKVDSDQQVVNKELSRCGDRTVALELEEGAERQTLGVDDVQQPPQRRDVQLQGYLAHKKTPRPRNLQ